MVAKIHLGNVYSHVTQFWNIEDIPTNFPTFLAIWHDSIFQKSACSQALIAWELRSLKRKHVKIINLVAEDTKVGWHPNESQHCSKINTYLA